MRYIFFLFLITTLCSNVYGTEISFFIKEAEKNNPELIEIKKKLKEYGYKKIFVFSLPDPNLNLSINDLQLFYSPLDRNLEPMQSISIGISQKIPYLKKLETEKEIVNKEFLIQKAKILAKRQEIYRDIYKTLYKIWLYTEKLRLIEEYSKLLESIIKLSNITYAVGNASQSDVINSQIYYMELRKRKIYVKSMLNQEKERLEYLIGKKVSISNLKIKEIKLEDLRILLKKVKNSPFLLKVKKEIEKQKEKTNLARLGLKPDFNVYVKYFYRKNFNDYISGGISFTLPFLNKKKYTGKILYEKQKEKVLVSKYKKEFLFLKEKIKEAFIRYLESKEKEEILNTLMKQSEKSFESVLSEFKVGKKNMVDVLFSLKQIITIKDELLENRFKSLISAISIKAILGELK